MSRSPTGRPAISPTAKNWPIDSTAMITITRTIASTAITSNRGAPWCSGAWSPSQPAVPDPGRSRPGPRRPPPGCPRPAPAAPRPRRGTPGEPVEQQDDAEGDGGQPQVHRGAEPGGARVPAAHLPGGHPHQRHPDDGDDGAGDQRREEAHQATEEGRDEEEHRPGRDHRAEDRGQPGLGPARRRPDGDQRGHGRRRHALHHRQPYADARQAHRLEQGGDAAGHQGRVDQGGGVGGPEPQPFGDQQRHDHGAGCRRQGRAGGRGRRSATRRAPPRPGRGPHGSGAGPGSGAAGWSVGCS